MRIFQLSVLCLIAAIPLELLGQAQAQPTFVIKLKYVRLDLPRSSSDSCLVVFPDGRFHLEQASDYPPSKAEIFEDSVTKDSLESLRTLLMAEELKSLETPRESGKIAQGEVVWSSYPEETNFRN